MCICVQCALHACVFVFIVGVLMSVQMPKRKGGKLQWSFPKVLEEIGEFGPWQRAIALWLVNNCHCYTAVNICLICSQYISTTIIVFNKKYKHQQKLKDQQVLGPFINGWNPRSYVLIHR